MVTWLERHQIPLYLAALLAGAVVGLAFPVVADPAEWLITPVLGLLLYATFLAVPLTRVRAALSDLRFLATVLVLNFVVVPSVVWAVSRLVAGEPALLVGVAFVLLAPCIDYVIVFTGLAGGDRERLLAATPLLMVGQMLLLPLHLWWLVGAEVVGTIDVRPFLLAFLLFIVVPLGAAAVTQRGASRSRKVLQGMDAAMVPLMMATLGVVVASQIHGVGEQFRQLVCVVPVYVLFAALMVPLAILAARVARLDVPRTRAAVFSAVTRNSLVILPLVLALPAAYALAPLVVVTQTLVELVIMVNFLRLVPRLVRQ